MLVRDNSKWDGKFVWFVQIELVINCHAEVSRCHEEQSNGSLRCGFRCNRPASGITRWRLDFDVSKVFVIDVCSRESCGGIVLMQDPKFVCKTWIVCQGSSDCKDPFDKDLNLWVKINLATCCIENECW